MKTASLAIATVLLLAACKGEDPQVAAQAAAAQAAAKEQAAEAMAKQFDDAVVAQNWTLAKAHGEILQIEHPTSAAAERVKPKLDEIKAKAEAAQQGALRAGVSGCDIGTDDRACRAAHPAPGREQPAGLRRAP